jgi:hypothetical protein
MVMTQRLPQLPKRAAVFLQLQKNQQLKFTGMQIKRALCYEVRVFY